MLIRHKLDRSWVLTWFLTLIVITALASVSLFYDPSKVKADPVIFENTDTAFRIVEVREEQGYLVIEAQHFYPDSSHWFYDLYSWQGREALNKLIALNSNGEKLLEDGSVAPYKLIDEDTQEQYIPHNTVYFHSTMPTDPERPQIPTDLVIGGDFEVGATKQDVINALGEPNLQTRDKFSYRVGPDWKYTDDLILDNNRILSTIQAVHSRRSVTGWTGDLGRVVLPQMTSKKKDFDNVGSLVLRFKVLEGTIYNYDGSLYEGDELELAEVQDYFERVDLRTEETKTYQTGPDTFKVVNGSTLHYQDENGDWKNTSLNFIEHVDIDGTPLWVMKTHPRYHAVGELNSISMVSPNGELGGRWYTPGPLTYEGQTAWYHYDGLKWTYTLTRTGIKLESEPVEARGERDYSFVFLPLGDLGPLTIDSNGNAVTGGIDPGEFFDESVFFYYEEEDFNLLEPDLVVPRAYIIGADGEKYPGGTWEIVDDYTIKFNFDDSMLPDEAFPYVIDPSMSFSSDLGHTFSDGHIKRSNTSWPPGGGTTYDYTATSMNLQKEKPSSNYEISLVKMQWDTSSLPDDAYITSAHLRIKFEDGLQYANNQDHCIHAMWQSGTNASHASVVGTYVWESEGYDNAINCIDLKDIYANGGHTYHNLPLENFGYEGIDARGTTGLQMGLKPDHDPNYSYYGGAGRSYVTFTTEEHPTYDPPTLVVNYSLPGVLACNSTTARFYPNKGTGGDDGIDASLARNASGFAPMPDVMVDPAGFDNNYYDVPDSYSGFYPGTNYSDVWIPVMGFDTSSLPLDATILRGSISIVRTRSTSTWWNDDGLEEITFGFVDFDPASDNSYTALDWLEFGTQLVTIEKEYQALSDDEIIRHQFDLNAAGREYVNLSGVTHVALMDEFTRGGQYPRSTAIDMHLNARGIFQSWITADGAHYYGQGGAMTPGEYLSAETGNQAPLLEVEYITPCSFIDGDLSTVSDTVTASFTPYREGYVQCDPSGVVAWVKLHQAVAADGSCGGGLAAAQAKMENNGASNLGTTGAVWDWTNRAVLVYDTSSLPDYRSSCTVNQTTTLVTNHGNDVDSADGYINVSTTGKNFTGLKNNYSTGNTSSMSDPEAWSGMLASTTTDQWDMMQRGTFVVDNTSIPTGALITGASLHLYGKTIDADYANDGMVLIDYDPGTEQANTSIWDIAMSDMIRLSDPIRMDKLTTSGYNVFKFNTAGVRMIQQSITPAYDYLWFNQIPMMITSLSDTGAHEILDTNFSVTGQPGWVSGGGTRLLWYTQEESGTSKDPYLEVYYDMPCPGILEAELWIWPSSQAPTSFHNPSNVDTFELGHVELNSPSTIGHVNDYPSMLGVSYGFVPLEHAKITSDAGDPIIIKLNEIGLTAIDDGSGGGYLGTTADGYTEFAGRIGADMHYREELAANPWGDTSTGYMLRDSGIKFANNDPTLYVTHGDVANAFIDAMDINAGGKTLVLNVFGGIEIPSAGFSAERQNIINGITGSHGAGSDNWNEAVRDNMVVGDVVRTDDNTITITFTGPYSYAPASTETITASIPASAIGTVYEPVVVSPVFLVDKIPFNFTSFTPTIAANSGTLQITLIGAGLPEHSFGGSEAVTLIKSGQPNIDCSSVSGTGGASVVVDCIVNGVATGNWDVYVENATGLNDIKLAALTLFQSWSSTVNGGSFSASGSDYAVFAHDALPYFTVQEFDEVNRTWGSSSALPAVLPTNAGLDTQFSSDKTRLVVGTESSVSSLWTYEFDPATGIVGPGYDLPASLVSTDVLSVDIPSGDNVLGTTTNAGDYFYVYDIDNGAVIGSFYTSILASPVTKPTGTCNDIDFSPNIQYLAVACDTSPFILVYNFDNATPAIGTKLADPSYIPSSPATSVEFSPDGTKLAVTAGTYLTVYDFPSMTTYTNQTVSTGNDVAWLNESITGNTLIAVASNTTPYIEIYPFNTSTGYIGTKLADPDPALSSAANVVGFHPNDDTVFVGQASSPFVTAYKFRGVSDDDYKIYRGFLEFDTSILPTGATITGANVKLYASADNTDTEFEITLTDGALITPPITNSIFDMSPYPSAVLGQLDTTFWIDGQYNTISLTDVSTISTVGVTKYLVRSNNDIAGTPTPTTKEWVEFYSTDEAGTTKDPIIVLTYTVTPGGESTTIPITGGYHTLEIESDGSNPLTFKVDSVQVSTNENIMSVADTVTDWTYLMNGVMPYMRYIKQDVSSSNMLHYELLAPIAETLQDVSGEANHSSRSTLPDEIVAITTTVGPLAPISEDVIALSDTLNPDVVSEVGPPLNPFGSDDGTASLPSALGEYLNFAGTMSGYPTRFFTVGLALMTILLLGILAMKATGGSLVISAFTMGVGILFWVNVGTGVLPFWVLIVYGFFSITAIVWGRQVPSI